MTASLHTEVFQFAGVLRPFHLFPIPLTSHYNKHLHQRVGTEQGLC